MNEDEILLTIRALEYAVIDTGCVDQECCCGFNNSRDRALAYAARDALTIELKNIRAGRPWGAP